MRRVAVTGMGIVSPIGNDRQTVLDSLYHGHSGITESSEMSDLGFRSRVHGRPTIEGGWEALVPRKDRRQMSEGIGWAYIAMLDAIKDASLTPETILGNPRIGVIAGSGGPSVLEQHKANFILERDKSPRKIGPFAVPPAMCSGVSANLAVAFKLQGISFSIASACATSAHCIGVAAEKIMHGKQDVMFAGGCEELEPRLSALFDAIPAMSQGFNATPSRTPRAYDKNRDGFVIAGGAGILVLEEMNRALSRGVRIYAEVAGYGETSDGRSMVEPSGEGAERCMKMALQGFGNLGPVSPSSIGYINTHGTATPIGDSREIGAIKKVFADRIPLIASTKSLTGHSLGAAGVWEAIFSLLMMDNNFVCASANIEELDPEFDGVPIVRVREDGIVLDAVMSNSFGFGGTNATLVFRRYAR